MEWPIVRLPSADEDELVSSDAAQAEVVDDGDDVDISALSGTSSTIQTMMITQEIYARAALGCVSDSTVDHRATGLQDKVETFLDNLHHATSIANHNNWVTYEYRTLSQEFTELMAFASTIIASSSSSSSSSSSRLLEICQSGLDAVHDLMKYRVPTTTTTSSSSDATGTVLTTRDAYLFCHSLSPKLTTQRLVGTRPPDLDYKFGLVLEDDNINHDDYDTNAVDGVQACHYITQLRKQGFLEISASSLAKYTVTSRHNVVATRLSHKTTFVVLGCDHPMAPTKSLLRIPGVTVYGIPTSWTGFEDIVEYVRVQSPDNTTFLYPTNNGGGTNDGGSSSGGSSTRHDSNYILSHGPQIAQWILDNTTTRMGSSNDGEELVIVPMPASNSHTESAVRYAASSDLILQRVLRTHCNNQSSSNKKKKISLWMYQSSQTCMIVPPASTTKSQELLQQRPSYESWIHTLSMNTVLTPSYSNDDDDDEEDTATATAATTTTSSTNDVENNNHGVNQINNNGHHQNQNHDYAIVNGIIAAPGGAHHVLVETIRMWRCLITNLAPHDDYDYNDNDYDDDDDDVDNYDTTRNSNNDVHVFAPYIPLWKTTNASNGSNGSGIGGEDGKDELVMEANHLQLFESRTAASLMTSIGLAGILDPIVNRPMPTIEHGYYETTPFALFWEGSVHGGVWNCPYTVNSVSGISGYVLGKVYQYYDTYYSSTATTAEAGGGAAVSSSVVNTATTITPSGTNHGEVNHNKASSDSSSSSSPSSSSIIVDAVPSTFGAPMPDLVRERLEILA